MPPELATALTWAAESAVALLLATVVFFLKRLVDQHEANGRAIQKLRENLQRWKSAVESEIQSTRSGVRILAERMRIRYKDIEGLSDERLDLPTIEDDRDSTKMIE